MTKAAYLGYLIGMRKRAADGVPPNNLLGGPSAINRVNRGLQRSLEGAAFRHSKDVASAQRIRPELISELRAMPTGGQAENNRRIIQQVKGYDKLINSRSHIDSNIDRALKNRSAYGGAAGLLATLKGIGSLPAAGVLTGQAGLPIAALGGAGVAGAGAAGALAGHGIDRAGKFVTPDRTSLSDWWGKTLGNVVTPLNQ